MDLTQRLPARSPSSPAAPAGSGWRPAKRMRAEGATIVIGDIDPATGKTVADDLGRTVRPRRRRPTRSAVDALFDTAAETYGSVDIAFNNAGISPARRRPDREHRARGLAAGAGRQPQVGVSVLPGGVAAHGAPQKGSIINTASFVAVMGSATSQISYTASKGGVLAMSRELGVQYARRASGSTRCAPDR